MWIHGYYCSTLSNVFRYCWGLWRTDHLSQTIASYLNPTCKQVRDFGFKGRGTSYLNWKAFRGRVTSKLIWKAFDLEAEASTWFEKQIGVDIKLFLNCYVLLFCFHTRFTIQLYLLICLHHNFLTVYRTFEYSSTCWAFLSSPLFCLLLTLFRYIKTTLLAVRVAEHVPLALRSGSVALK